ncbi:hypothetical protein GCM10020000_72900 [Streptomyces olivoverticillatus]
MHGDAVVVLVESGEAHAPVQCGAERDGAFGEQPLQFRLRHQADLARGAGVREVGVALVQQVRPEHEAGEVPCEPGRAPVGGVRAALGREVPDAGEDAALHLGKIGQQPASVERLRAGGC